MNKTITITIIDVNSIALFDKFNINLKLNNLTIYQLLPGQGAPEAERVLPEQQGRDTQEAEREGQDEAGQGPSDPVPVPDPGTLCPSVPAVPAADAAAAVVELSHDGAIAEGGGDDGF